MADTDTQELDEFLGAKPKPWWQRHLKWIAILIGVVLLVLLLSRCFAGEPAPEYQTAQIERDTLNVTVSATGKLAPTNQVDVGSELSGLVTKVVVDVNDRVTKGQPLALVDPSRFQDTVNQSRAALQANQAQVAQAKATVDQSRANLDRLEEVSRLSDGKVPSKTEMETARADYNRAIANLRAAEANVVSAQAQLSSNQTQLTKTVIRSPVNGVVLARQIDAGQTVAASFNTPTLFVIAEDLSEMKLEVAVDEADVGKVKAGQKASFTVDAFPGKTFPATIKRVDVGSNLSAESSSSSTSSSASNSQVVSYGAVLSVANTDLVLRPGMTATATIEVAQRKNVMLIPNGALRFTPSDDDKPKGGLTIGPGAFGSGEKRQKTIGAGSRQTIYILGQDGKPQPIEIVTGDTDGSRTEVSGDKLKAGMKVILGKKAKADNG